MKSMVLILTLMFFQASMCQKVLDVPSPDSNFFYQWLVSFDPNSTPGERNSVLCENAPDAFYPFPGEPCSGNYFACVGGIQYNQTCPNDYIYDPNIGRCLSADSVTCQVATTTIATTEPSTTGTTIPFQCSVDGFYPITSCSASFYACIGGLLYPQHCPGNGLFDPSISACVSPDNLPLCTTTSTSSTSTASTAVSTSSYFPPSSTLPTLPTLPSLPTFTFPVLPTLPTFPALPTLPTLPPLRTTTGTTLAATSTTTDAPFTTSAPFECPASEGFFAIPGACTADFIICVSGSPYAQSCPVGIFDPVSLICLLPESASAPCTVTTEPTSTIPPTTSTTPATTTTTPVTIPTTSKPSFVCPGSGQYPYPGSCSLYYVCGGGVYIIASCPIGQVFNPSTQFCEDPVNVPGCYFNFENFYQGAQLVGFQGNW